MPSGLQTKKKAPPRVCQPPEPSLRATAQPASGTYCPHPGAMTFLVISNIKLLSSVGVIKHDDEAAPQPQDQARLFISPTKK